MVPSKETQPLLVKVSSYNEKRGKWTLDVLGATVGYHNIFQAEVRDHQAGPVDSLPSVVIVPGYPFRFACLPPEVRNMVYNYLFPQVNVFYHERARDEEEEETDDEIEHDVADEYEYGHADLSEDESEGKSNESIDMAGESTDMTKEKFFSDEHLAITRVSRDIRHEAMPILFGNTRFLFKDIAAFHGFIGKVQDRRIYLRQVQVEAPFTRYRSEARTKFFRVLVDCTRLERLRLTCNCSRSLETNAGELYEDAKFWIHTLALARGNRKAALDVLTVDGMRMQGQKWLHWVEYFADEFSGKLETCIIRDHVLKDLLHKGKLPAAVMEDD
ncbi:MAG: hypothetical protein Q9165_001181 [Trypethelium subeluteriae]